MSRLLDSWANIVNASCSVGWRGGQTFPLATRSKSDECCVLIGWKVLSGFRPISQMVPLEFPQLSVIKKYKDLFCFLQSPTSYIWFCITHACFFDLSWMYYWCPDHFSNIDVIKNKRQAHGACVCVGWRKGLKKSLHPLTHPPLFFFSFFCFGPIFLRLAFFVTGQCRVFLK